MELLTLKQLDAICDFKMDESNGLSLLAGLNRFGHDCGLDRPHRLAQYVAQVCHESMAFQYDREIWGPTPAQKRYDQRTDLGNTPERDGDGYRYRGRGSMMITGTFNYADFTRWAHDLDPKAPDFVANPDAVLTDPWEGLGPIWYWDTHNLNSYADRQQFKVAFKGVTRVINGGMNGYGDRRDYYDVAALVLLGYGRSDVEGFQNKVGLKADGDIGPLTRQALHEALMALPSIPQRRPFWGQLFHSFMSLFQKRLTHAAR
ncbi:MAG: glycoside hydrolase family 19 protein [Pseudoruegeria sp.]